MREMDNSNIKLEEFRAKTSSVAFEQASIVIKSILLFNGGGVLSILAFMGSSGFKSLNVDLLQIKIAFSMFSIGAVLSLMTAFISFLAAAMHAHHMLNEGYDKSFSLRIVGCFLAVKSIAFFCLGSGFAISAI